MNYEEKYKEALDLMKDCVPDENGLVHVHPEEIFPELKKSEDEKIKRIIDSLTYKISQHLHDIFTEEEFQCFDAWSNAWLERQAEQKPTKWSEEDVQTLDRIISNYQYFCMELSLKEKLTDVERTVIGNVNKEDIDWLKSLKERIGG